MTRLFGTDGVRGVANRDLTPDLALALGRAAGRVLASPGERVVVGRDTRRSGPMLEAALVAGLCSAGVDSLAAGIVPSPAVAWLALHHKARAGAVVSASHNPVDDNGIKFFSEVGAKVTVDTENDIEAAMVEDFDGSPVGPGVGDVESLPDGIEPYAEHLLAALGTQLEGVHVVLDCAHGAAWWVAPEVFRRAGARVDVIHDTPDGSKINVDCGSTSLGDLKTAVLETQADLGLAFDGDADRVLAVDETGRTLDGDHIMGIAAMRLQDERALDNDLLVATVMSNLGFLRALEHRGIEVITAPVGDKFVAEAMTETGAVLGGEQSGHVIFARHAPTGDGILTGLHLAAATAGRRLSELARFYEPYPQVLLNVEVTRKDALDASASLWEEVRLAEEGMGDEGRIVVRASGTEPVVRVMVESSTADAARRVAEHLAGVVRKHLGDAR